MENREFTEQQQKLFLKITNLIDNESLKDEKIRKFLSTGASGKSYMLRMIDKYIVLKYESKL